MMNKVAVLSVTALLLAGCSRIQPVPSPTASPEPSATLTPTPEFPLPEGTILFEESANKKFTGTVTGRGSTAILLANMAAGGERQWDPFVEAADKNQFTVVTFNYLQPDFTGAVLNIDTVYRRLASAGYRRILCIGASLGVTACGSVAHLPQTAGLVLISGPNNGDRLDNVLYPKLFIAADRDPAAKAIQTAYENAANPKQLILFADNGAHGTELF